MTGQTIYFTNGLVDEINKFDRFYFDKRLKLFQVTCHTAANIRFSGFNDTIIYDIESVTGTTEGIYHNLYGGFYQGFYKLFGYDYDILPDRVSKGWTVEMLLRPRITASTVNSGETTLNELYPDNKNTFFFLGARAENKFYHHADGTPNCFTGYTRVTEDLTKLETCACCNRTVTNSRCIYVYPPRSAGGVHDSHANYSCSQCNGNVMTQTTCGCGCDKIACETCGWECQVHECAIIIEVTPTPTPTPASTSTGCVLPPVCTPTCNTCSNCTSCDDCVYTGFSSVENTCESDPMYDWLSNNISLRLCGNVKNPGIGIRALRMTGDCSTTGNCGDTGTTYTTGHTVVDYCSPPIYDYLTTYCNSEEPTILDVEHWIQINVVWERYTWYSPEELCGKGGLNLFSKEVYLQSLAGNSQSLIAPPYTNGEQVSEKIEIVSLNENWLIDKNDRRGRLKIFVNGYLHHTIDDFEEVIPRGLSTDKEKQVGVPFNISWGGGSQGLIENLTFTSLSALTGPYQQDPECFPTNDLTGTTFNGLETNIVIEKYFAGTFEGGISQFRFYVEPLSAGEIRHNFRLLQGKFELLNRSCPGCSANDGGENCNTDDIEFVIGTPTMTPSQTNTPVITKTPAPTKTQTKTPAPTKTPQVTPTQTPRATRTPLSTSTPTKTTIPTQTVTKTQTITPTVSPTITNTPNGNYYNYNLCDTDLATTNGPTGVYTYEIYVGYDVGIVTLNYQAGNIPSKFQIQWDSTLVADSGFRGNPIYNSQLNSLGYPNVVGTSIGNISFNKNIAGPETLFVIITSPIGPVNFNINVSCPPIPTPTPTLTKTPTNTPTITRTNQSTPTNTQTITRTLTQTPSPTFVHSFTGISECNVQNQVVSGFSGEYVYQISLGSGIGPVGLNYDAINVPDKFTVIWNGVEVINTGFRGLPFYNPQLASLGYPPVVGPGSGYTSFIKSSSTPTEATVYVLAPISNTAWRFTLECPVLPTPTTTPTQTITPTTPRRSFIVLSANSESSSCYGGETTTIYGFNNDFDYNTEFYNNPYGPVTEDISGFYNFNGIVVELNSEGVVISLFELCLTPTPTPTATSAPTETPIATSTPTETPTQTVTVSITETLNYLSPTPSLTETVTPTPTPTITITKSETPTMTPTQTISYYTYILGSGETISESCNSYYSSPFELYGPLAGGMGPNVGESIYENSGTPPTNPAPDGFYSNGVGYFIVSGGTGLIVASDPDGCVEVITPTPTKSNTPTPTITNTSTVTPTTTPTVSTINCLCFVVTNDTLLQVTIEYIDCYGNTTLTLVDPETIYNLCAQSVIDSGSLLYYQNGYCSYLGEGFGCDYVNTPTPTPTNTETPTPSVTITQTVTPTITITPTNTETPTTTVTPSTSGINEITPTPSVTITQTVTPSSGSTPSCPYQVGFFNTSGNVMRFDYNGYDNQIYVVTTGGTEVYDTSYSYIQTIPNSFTAGTPTSASIVFVSEFVYVGGDPSNKSIDIYDTINLTANTVNIGTSVLEMSVDRTGSHVGFTIDTDDYQQITVSTQDPIGPTNVTATTNGDISLSRIDDYFWIVSSGDTLVKFDSVTKLIASTETIASGGYSGYRKTLLDDPNNGYTYILVNGQSLMIYDGGGFNSEIDLTSYSGTNTSMTIDQNNNKLYILNVVGNVFGLIKIDITTLTDEGLFTLGSYAGYTNGEIIYELNNTEILFSLYPYINRINRVCT
jgi:hypothetical protein